MMLVRMTVKFLFLKLYSITIATTQITETSYRSKIIKSRKDSKPHQFFSYKNSTQSNYTCVTNSQSAYISNRNKQRKSNQIVEKLTEKQLKQYRRILQGVKTEWKLRAILTFLIRMKYKVWNDIKRAYAYRKSVMGKIA